MKDQNNLIISLRIKRNSSFILQILYKYVPGMIPVSGYVIVNEWKQWSPCFHGINIDREGNR